LGLPIPPHFKQNGAMEDKTEPAEGVRGLWQWATTRPQAYATYFLALVLIGGLSFYAGTLKPKRPPPSSQPAAVSPPQG
jgi:hypothetical protein